jgi:acyl-CoA hydrolase
MAEYNHKTAISFTRYLSRFCNADGLIFGGWVLDELQFAASVAGVTVTLPGRAMEYHA